MGHHEGLHCDVCLWPWFVSSGSSTRFFPMNMLVPLPCLLQSRLLAVISQMLILGRKVLDVSLLEVRSFGCLTVLPCRWLMYHWAVPLMDETSSIRSLRL